MNAAPAPAAVSAATLSTPVAADSLPRDGVGNRVADLPPTRPTRPLPAGNHSMAPASANTAAETRAPAETPQQAHARGLAEGEARALARLRQQTDSREARFRDDSARLAAREKSLITASHALASVAGDYAGATEETLVRLTLLACAHVLQRLAVEHTLITRVVQAVMAEHGNEAGIELLLNRADHAALPADALAALPMVVLPADDVAAGEFRVRTTHRQLDIAIARQYRNLCGVLRRDASDDH